MSIIDFIIGDSLNGKDFSPEDDTTKKSLKDIYLEPDYNPDENDIIKEFYAPCLKVSIKYDRAVGYFRANIYRELGEDLLDFVSRGGKVRILCSPDIPEKDESFAREGYDSRGKRNPNEIENDFIKVLESMSQDPDERDCLEMLRLLIEKEALELFIASREGGIFHRKVGAFFDEYDNVVVFSGSGNETYMAVCSFEYWGNDEEFDVYRSWGENYEIKKVKRKLEYLRNLYEGKNKYTKVRPLNQLERDYISKFRTYNHLEDCRKGARKRSNSRDPMIQNGNISPYHYQKEAIEDWKDSERIGILAMATGTGKTITALFAISGIINEGRPILILVPTNILLSQWHKEVRNIYPNVPIMLAGKGHNWKNNPHKRTFISDIPLPKIIIATMKSASSDDFIEYFKQAEDPILIADEVHRLGSPTNRKILSSIKFKERLGLSATPERLYDAQGNQALTMAFGDSPVYNLDIGDKVKISDKDEKEIPILGNFLSRYNYYFETVSLTQAEQEKWDNLTKQINKLIAMKKDKEESIFDNDNIKLKLIKRSRIIKNAEQKIECACKIVSEKYPANGKWIVYCEDENQLDQVSNALKRLNRYSIILTYHSNMPEHEKERNLNFIENNPAIIVSIRCLDEGVDIPTIDGAVVLASSKNPREYVQRRGRVLRKSKDKKISTIIDCIVTPNISVEEVDTLPIIKAEINRAYNFSQHAENKGITHELWLLARKYDVNIESDYEFGLEDDEEDN